MYAVSDGAKPKDKGECPGASAARVGNKPAALLATGLPTAMICLLGGGALPKSALGQRSSDHIYWLEPSSLGPPAKDV
jgi:hypothetical protein